MREISAHHHQAPEAGTEQVGEVEAGDPLGTSRPSSVTTITPTAMNDGEEREADHRRAPRGSWHDVPRAVVPEGDGVDRHRPPPRT